MCSAKYGCKIHLTSIYFIFTAKSSSTEFIFRRLIVWTFPGSCTSMAGRVARRAHGGAWRRGRAAVQFLPTFRLCLLSSIIILPSEFSFFNYIWLLMCLVVNIIYTCFEYILNRDMNICLDDLVDCSQYIDLWLFSLSKYSPTQSCIIIPCFWGLSSNLFFGVSTRER